MPTTLFADIALFPYEPPLLAAVVLLVFLMFLGGAIGSFLNVVIYRVPAGLSIVKPRSRCPRCFTPILARDNLPMIGWLLLRGRCRACRAPISARYPLVELAAGAAFTLLCVGEAVFPGAILPIPRSVAVGGYPLFGSTVYHFALACGLGAAALMAHDRAVVPVGFWRIILLIGIVPALLWPDLRPIAFAPLDDGYGRLVYGLADGCVGTLYGALVGIASWPVSTIAARARSGHVNGMAALACVGAFLGWQAAAGIALAAAVAAWLRAPLQRAGLPVGRTWLPLPAVFTLAWILLWRPIVGLSYVGGSSLFGAKSPAWFPVVALVGTFGLSLSARMLAGRLSGEPTSFAAGSQRRLPAE